MKDTTRRSLLRWLHLIPSIPVIGYVYSPFHELPSYSPVVRYIAIPLLVLSGLGMWKGHVFLRRSLPRATGNAGRVGANG